MDFDQLRDDLKDRAKDAREDAKATSLGAKCLLVSIGLIAGFVAGALFF